MTDTTDRVGVMAECLEGMLAAGSDVQLTFDEGEIIPGHSLILRQSSKVLAAALETESSSRHNANNEHDSGAAEGGAWVNLPMQGTSKEAWLMAIAFLYPVVPTPEVDWHNVQVLLEVGSKYDMPALLFRAGKFLVDHMQELNAAPTSSQFAWKWIMLADRSGLTKVATACIDAKVQDSAFVAAYNSSLIAGMSRPTMEHLMTAFAQLASKARCPAETADSVYCKQCGEFRRCAVTATSYGSSRYYKLTCRNCDSVISF